MANSSCTLTLCSGTHYDLSSLSSAKSDYVAKVGSLEYKLNVCRSVVSELWHVDDADKVGAYVSREGGDFSMGQVNTSLWLSPTNDQPMIYLENGSPCKHNPSEKASTAIRFVCRPDIFEAGTPELIAAFPPGRHEEACHFFFDWPTHVACPQSPKKQLQTAHVMGFFGFLFAVILAWFVGHTLYNRFVLKKTGRAVLPILSLPSMGGLGQSSSSSRPKWGLGRRASGYQGIRAEEHDEEEHFASRFSLEGDEEDEDLTGGNEAARALGDTANVWSGQPKANGPSQADAGIHRGLEHL